jgi:predicted outer membrane repeat protein
MMQRRRLFRAVGLALLAALSLPTGASATTFSFGTINPGDVISSLTFSPSTTKTSFDPITNTMHVEAYLSQINFASRQVITDPLVISGIAANTVLLTSDIMLVGGSLVVTNSAANNPRSLASSFTNGLVDLGIFDTVMGLPLLDTDYIGSLAFSATETGSVSFPLPITGQLSGDLVVLGTSDADFLSAFGPLAELDANFSGFFSDGASVTNNLCNLVRSGGAIYASAAQVCAGANELDDFETNAVVTIVPIPEPGSALLLALGLAGVAALRRK